MQAKESTHRSRSKGRKGRPVAGPEVPPGGDPKTRAAQGAPIPVWQGPVDPMALNDLVPGSFRTYCSRPGLSQAELARRARKDRQWLHRLLTDTKVCTLDIPRVMRFCEKGRTGI